MIVFGTMQVEGQIEEISYTTVDLAASSGDMQLKMELNVMIITEGQFNFVCENVLANTIIL